MQAYGEQRSVVQEASLTIPRPSFVAQALGYDGDCPSIRATSMGIGATGAERDASMSFVKSDEMNYEVIIPETPMQLRPVEEAPHDLASTTRPILMPNYAPIGKKNIHETHKMGSFVNVIFQTALRRMEKGSVLLTIPLPHPGRGDMIRSTHPQMIQRSLCGNE